MTTAAVILALAALVWAFATRASRARSRAAVADARLATSLDRERRRIEIAEITQLQPRKGDELEDWLAGEPDVDPPTRDL